MEEWLSAPAAYPAARLAIEALDPIVREALNRGLEPIDLRAGEALFACGDPRDAAFLILSGRVALTEQSPAGPPRPVTGLAPGGGGGRSGWAARGRPPRPCRRRAQTRVWRLGW